LRIEPLASPQLELTDFPLQRGQQIAALIARKLAVLIWHLFTNEEDYGWARPALMAPYCRHRLVNQMLSPLKPVPACDGPI
jgi:hypothetical protein